MEKSVSYNRPTKKPRLKKPSAMRNSSCCLRHSLLAVAIFLKGTTTSHQNSGGFSYCFTVSIKVRNNNSSTAGKKLGHPGQQVPEKTSPHGMISLFSKLASSITSSILLLLPFSLPQVLPLFMPILMIEMFHNHLYTEVSSVLSSSQTSPVVTW